jgi:hypothetical protein
VDAIDTLEYLRENGCEVVTDGGNIRVRQAKRILTPELRQSIASNKAALLWLLDAEQRIQNGPPKPPKVDSDVAELFGGVEVPYAPVAPTHTVMAPAAVSPKFPVGAC